MISNDKAPGARHLALGTVSFTVCFAAWGLISAFAPHFRQVLHLSATQTAFLCCGSRTARRSGSHSDGNADRPLWWTNHLFALMFFVALPLLVVPLAGTYRNLVIVAFFLGMAGSSFAVGVGYVSRWFSMERQGSALGVYGLGNIGQSAAVFLGPVVAAAFGYRSVYWGVAVIIAVWGLAFALLARNATRYHPAKERRRDAVRPGARASVVGAFGFLLPHLRRLCRLLHLSADAAQRSIWPTSGRRRFSHRRIRRTGDADASARRLALRSHRWLACSLVDLRSGLPRFALLLASRHDGALHGWGTWLRSPARDRQRRSLQAGAAVLSWPTGDGDGTGRSDGRNGRISFRRCCLAFSATAWALSGRASLLLALTACLLWWVNHRVFLPATRKLSSTTAAELRAYRRPVCVRVLWPRSGPRCWSPPS